MDSKGFELCHATLANARSALSSGDRSRAKRLMTSATVDHPRFAEPWSLLGMTMLEEGHYQEAINCFEQACRIDPSKPEYVFSLANAYGQAGAYAYASPLFQRYLRLNPSDSVAWALLGQSYAFSDRLSPRQMRSLVRPCLERALEIDAADPSLLMLVGGVSEHLGDIADAVNCYSNAAKYAPGEILPPYNLALVLQKLGQHELSLEMFQHVLCKETDVPEAHFGMANVLTELGQFELARSHYRKALESHANPASVLYNLCSITPVDNSLLTEVERRLSSLQPESAPQSELAYAQFALGKSYADLKRHDEAFAHYKRGNELLGSRFNAEAHSATVDEIIRVVRERSPLNAYSADAGFLAGPTVSLNARELFIVGMPRSGTTMIEQAIARETQVCLLGESSALPAAIDAVEDARDWPENAPANWLLASTKDFDQLRYYYHGEVNRSNETGLLLDKLPGNFHYLNWIAASFPDAKIIHCKRDARDVCLSCYFQPFSENFDFTNDLTQLALYYNDYARLMDMWRDVLGDRMLEVEYEQFVTAPERELKRLLMFVNGKPKRIGDTSSTTSAPIRTASHWQARQNIHQQSVGKWRLYENHLAPLIANLRVLRREEGSKPSAPHLFNTAGIETSSPQGFAMQ